MTATATTTTTKTTAKKATTKPAPKKPAPKTNAPKRLTTVEAYQLLAEAIQNLSQTHGQAIADVRAQIEALKNAAPEAVETPAPRPATDPYGPSTLAQQNFYRDLCEQAGMAPETEDVIVGWNRTEISAQIGSLRTITQPNGPQVINIEGPPTPRQIAAYMRIENELGRPCDPERVEELKTWTRGTISDAIQASQNELDEQRAHGAHTDQSLIDQVNAAI